MIVYLKKEYLFFAVLAIFFFPFSGLSSISQSIVYIRDIACMIAFTALIYCTLKRLNIKKIYSICIYSIYLIINTLIHQADIVQASVNVFIDAGIFLLVVYAVERKKYRELITAFATIFDIQLLVNLFHMLISKNGFGLTRSNNKIFILSSDNGLMFYIIAFVVVHELKNEIKPYGFIRDFLFYSVICIELMIGESATSYFVFTVLILCVIYCRRYSLNRLLYLSCGAVVILNFLLIIVRKIQFMQDIFSKMGKNISISGRIYVWDIALVLITQSPVWGYGVFDNLYYIMINRVEMEAHNIFLSCMLQGGVVFLAIFIFMILQSCHRIIKSRTHMASCLAMGLICYLIEFLVESPSACPGFFMVMALCQFGGDIHD